MGDKKWVDPNTLPWYQDLLEGAAEAQDRYGDDELERFAEEWNKTPEGIAWAEFVSKLKWRIGGANE